MAEFKGSILELNNKKAVVMTDKCDFITIKRTPDMFLGQQLTFKETSEAMFCKTNRYLWKVAGLAAVFVLALFSVLYFQVFYPVSVYAYIDLDINPSMEFSVDKYSKVLEVKALNSDAQKLLKDLDLEEIPVKKAIFEVIESSKNMGFISTEKSNKVLVSASLKKTDSTNAVEEDKALSDILSEIENINVKVGQKNLQPEVLKVDPEVRKAAVKNNISMGRYKLYEDIKKTDPSLTIEKAKKERVSDMLDKAETKTKNKPIKKNNSEGKPEKDTNKNSNNDVKTNKGNDSKINEHRDASAKKNKAKDVFNNQKPDKPSEKGSPGGQQKKEQPPKTDRNKPNNSIKSQSVSDWPDDYSNKSTDNKNATSSENSIKDAKTNKNLNEKPSTESDNNKNPSNDEDNSPSSVNKENDNKESKNSGNNPDSSNSNSKTQNSNGNGGGSTGKNKKN